MEVYVMETRREEGRLMGRGRRRETGERGMEGEGCKRDGGDGVQSIALH